MMAYETVTEEAQKWREWDTTLSILDPREGSYFDQIQCMLYILVIVKDAEERHSMSTVQGEGRYGTGGGGGGGGVSH